MDKLQRKLAEIARAGMRGEVKDAPHDAVSFDKMIIVWLERAKPFLYQVHFWNSELEKIVATFN